MKKMEEKKRWKDKDRGNSNLTQIPFTADTSTLISMTNNYSDLWEKSMTNAADELKDAQRVQ